ncbi:MAG: arginase [Calditrichaeota bacterium]|nr:MAG: arginase [Calditrichota bacterium]
MGKQKPVQIIGVPMDLGQSRRGVDMGPSAVRYAGLLERIRRLGFAVEDLGNVEVSVRDTLPAEGGLAYLPSIVHTCNLVAEQGRQSIADGKMPVFLGGDHSIAMGTVAGVQAGESVGVIWVDAHGDCNTPETSPSGNIHGMPLAALMGFGWEEMINVGGPGAKLRPEDVVMIGVRDLDPGEKTFLRQQGVTVFTMREIDERGIGQVAREALSRLPHGRLHVSLDMDVLDPWEAPGVGTPVPGGLTYREAHLLMELLCDDGRVASLDVVEINPILDYHNRTAERAVDLVASLLGQSIL